MELNIARLKVIGEAEIVYLDEKIKEYQTKNKPSILDKDISQINLQIKDMQALYDTLQQEYNSKSKEINDLKSNLKKLYSEYDIRENSIKELENKNSFFIFWNLL